MATRKTRRVTQTVTASKPSETKFVKGAIGKSLPKKERDDPTKKDNDLVKVQLVLANDIQTLTVLGNVEIYDHGNFEFRMYRKEFEYMRDNLLETELDLIEESERKAKRKQARINEQLDKGIIGNRQASSEMQHCNAPAFFYQEIARGMKPIRHIEIVEELGPENTPESEREALIKALKVTV